MAALIAKSSVSAAVARPAKANKMLVWQPTNNKFFETFSYLPPLSDAEIARQVEYVVNNGWTPCLEFAESSLAYTANTNTVRMGAVTACYQDNRYWTMWKLPMFGCQDPSQVLGEVRKCQQAFPEAYVRMVAFDSVKQVQMVSFLVQRPKNAADWCPVEQRSVGGAAPAGRSSSPAPERKRVTYSW